jgi:hypothetical protein
LSAAQHLQISHNLRRASGSAAPPLKGKLVQIANMHLAIARLKAATQQAESLSAAKTACAPNSARSSGISRLRPLSKERGVPKG